MEEKVLQRLDGNDHGHHRVRVLYIAGWGRSGSTILGRTLGQANGFSSVGEMRYIWDRGLVENRLCGCGVPFGECPMWQEALSHAFGHNFGVDAEEIIGLRERGVRTRHLLPAPAKTSRLRARLNRMGEYLGVVEKLYRAVEEVTQSRVIVDISKFPSYGYLLQNVPGIELYVLHLVRDPRAVAYSWGARRKPSLDRSGDRSDLMAPHGLIESSLTWAEWNLTIESTWRRRTGRYMLLRYEDFVRAPRTHMESILRFVGEEATQLSFENEHQIRLGASHMFSGNPNRFQGGPVNIKPDDVWKLRMGAGQQSMVAALTWPGLIRYGYPLLPQRPRGE